ncbi:cupin domain-containing protein [Actinomadura atramentaria]|uniref:cupin domain-containing protein n=1 Tax=Actinomadura atramentaria TaxID=1990 RepID=UPI000370CC7A|nr:hypothetical protein [Actinomadura atramentaria]
MPVIRRADARRTETPGGVMTTLASPAQGGADVAVWHTAAPAGSRGPRHTFDSAQVWTFLTGDATIDLDGETLSLAEGDTAVLPADLPRQVVAGSAGFTAVVAGPAGMQVYDAVTDCDLARELGERATPPWIV